MPGPRPLSRGPPWNHLPSQPAGHQVPAPCHTRCTVGSPRAGAGRGRNWFPFPLRSSELHPAPGPVSRCLLQRALLFMAAWTACAAGELVGLASRLGSAVTHPRTQERTGAAPGPSPASHLRGVLAVIWSPPSCSRLALYQCSPPLPASPPTRRPPSRARLATRAHSPFSIKLYFCGCLSDLLLRKSKRLQR